MTKTHRWFNVWNKSTANQNELLLNSYCEHFRRYTIENDINTSIADSIVERAKQVMLSHITDYKYEFEVRDAFLSFLQEHITHHMMTLNAQVKFSKKKLNIISVHGSCGAGKTTFCGKLCKFLISLGFDPMRIVLTSCDNQRPAAHKQLQCLANKNSVSVIQIDSNSDIIESLISTKEIAEHGNAEILILDTPGLTETEENFANVINITGAIKPTYAILLIDGNSGQSSYLKSAQVTKRIKINSLAVSKSNFQKNFGAIINTTFSSGKGISFFSTVEDINDLSVFNAKNFTEMFCANFAQFLPPLKLSNEKQFHLIKKTSENNNRITFNDVLKKLESKKNLENIFISAKYINNPKEAKSKMIEEEKKITSQIAIIQSMTKKERCEVVETKFPNSVIARIAKGSGLSISYVNHFFIEISQNKNT